MSRLPHVRQIIDAQPNSGRWNMAVDEVLLQSAIDREVATLRWYQWCEPTVSMGYFQRAEELKNDPRLSTLPRVRRLSGGGTLVHDQELTYSLALPVSQRLIERPMDLYRLVHQVFIDVFRKRGIELSLRGATLKRATEPVLCFAREDENDLVLTGHKVLGSAQRRRRGAILQHGGLLLKASEITPELLGIVDLAPKTDLSALPAELGDSLLREISDTRENGTLDSDEVAAAQRISAIEVDSK
jgi:lipoate-protein ligase A